MSFSIFAQESDQLEDSEGVAVSDGPLEKEQSGKSDGKSLKSRKAIGNSGVDLSQNYLAKSSSAVNALSWTRDGKYFATSWNNSIILWNAASDSIAAIYSNSVSESINPLVNAISLQFTSDSRYMMSVRDDNTILIHSVESQADSTLITGTGEPMSDAVYAGDYKIILPLDGQNLYESYKSGDQYIVEEKLDFSDGIWALSANPSGLRVLVTSNSGYVRVVDTESWNVLSEENCYTLSRIKPKFAPDGIHYVAAQNVGKLTVASTDESAEAKYIEDAAGFSYAVDFSSDSSLLVAGLSSGNVKIYDVNSGMELNSFKLMYGDCAKSLAFSPDDKYVIIGTEQGYIYRWVLSGEDFVPDYGYYQELEYENGVTGENRFGNILMMNLGFSGLNSKYYIGRIFFELGYRHFINRFLYVGGDASVGAGIPTVEYPYNYTVEGAVLNSPYLYNFSTKGTFGVSYFYKPWDLRLLADIGLGLSVAGLYDNSFDYAHSSGPYVTFVGQALAGIQWHWVIFAGGIQYDSSLKLLPFGKIGIAIPTRFFRK
ncbi:MAG: hypothetical protein K5873_06260 [Treponema sp.]|nr:hypothetical protein [Treponema sp.]